jgi:pimeloyl-ACP methyl ester carboxylesterase
MLVRRLLRILSIVILAILVIILVAVVGLFVYEPSLPEGYAFSQAGKTIQLSDGRTLAYLDIGDPEGRPVFYFHGGPGSRLEGLLFDELNQQLGIRMIVPDRPGFGLSDFQKERSFLDWPDDVNELANQLGIDRFAVVGWSSGGPHAAAVAHGIPDRLSVVAIVAGEGPYASKDYPRDLLTSDTFHGSKANKLFIWSANNSPWLMQTLFRAARLYMFRDPASSMKSEGDFEMSAKDQKFFTQDFNVEFTAEMIEALRQGSKGWTREFTIERLDWSFKLEDIHTPTVLVFHGDEDKAIHPKIGEYMCSHIPVCDEPTIYPGEGHSVVYYRYEEIIQSMLEAWE